MANLPNENQGWRDRWLEALRSGRYKQGQGQLRERNHYCCLGVLCDVLSPDGWGPDGQRIEDWDEGLLPPPVAQATGLTREMQWVLAGKNDSMHSLSFDEIAEFVEQRPWGIGGDFAAFRAATSTALDVSENNRG